jgi:hypothetical protein
MASSTKHQAWRRFFARRSIGKKLEEKAFSGNEKDTLRCASG